MLLDFQTLFSKPLQYHDFSLYIGGGRGAEGAFFHTFDWKSSHFMSIEVHKQPQFTCQADSHRQQFGLTPNVALLVCPNGTAHSIVDFHEFTGSQK